MLSPRNEHHFIGGLFSAIGNAFAAADTNDANERQAQLNRSFQRQEAQKTRDWQEKMWNKQNEYNSPEAMISRGLNPFTQSASGTGASVPTGAQAGSVSTPSMQAPHFDFLSVSGGMMTVFPSSLSKWNPSSEVIISWADSNCSSRHVCGSSGFTTS